MLPAELGTTAASPPAAQAPPAPSAILPFRVQEQIIIETAIAAFGGNIGRAAAALDISPSTIYRKREAWARPPLA